MICSSPHVLKRLAEDLRCFSEAYQKNGRDRPAHNEEGAWGLKSVASGWAPRYTLKGSALLEGWNRMMPSHCSQYSFAAVRRRTAAACTPRRRALKSRAASSISRCSCSTSVRVPLVQAPCSRPKECGCRTSSSASTRCSRRSTLSASPGTPQQQRRWGGGFCQGGGPSCTSSQAKEASATWFAPSHTVQGPRASAGCPTSPRTYAHAPPAASRTAHSQRCGHHWRRMAPLR
mmetsp:Transcript_3387/g.9165  ORF Transcript_3387/g.9165 Transcript_3387/m.9165 type:complete len:232 (-) Transcript_3387:875-1570(-)